MTSFVELLASIVPTDAGFAVDAPPSWSQGRTLYGGISSALCLEAVHRAFPDLPPLRSAQIAFVGPASGNVSMHPTILRRGKSTAFVACDLVSDGGIATQTTFCFAADRESGYRVVAPLAPFMPAPDDCPEFFDAERRPSFVGNFDIRLAKGAPLVSGADEADNWLWIRHRDSGAGCGTVAMLALADAAPPATFSLLTKPTAVSTMCWSLDLFGDAFTTTEGWWLSQSATDHLADGYGMQAMSLWNRGGVQVLAGRQSVAIFS